MGGEVGNGAVFSWDLLRRDDLRAHGYHPAHERYEV